MEVLFRAVNKKFQALQTAVQRPALYLSDEFYTMRNQIDLEAESLIANNNRLTKLDDELMYDEINELRSCMITELKLVETKLITSIEHHHFDDEFNRFRERLENYNRLIESALESIKNEEEDEQRMIRLELDLNGELNRFRKLIFHNQTVLFKRSFLNDLGILVIYEDAFMSTTEIDFITSIDYSKLPKHEIEYFWICDQIYNNSRDDFYYIKPDFELNENFYLIAHFDTYIKQLYQQYLIEINKITTNRSVTSARQQARPVKINYPFESTIHKNVFRIKTAQIIKQTDKEIKLSERHSSSDYDEDDDEDYYQQFAFIFDHYTSITPTHVKFKRQSLEHISTEAFRIFKNLIGLAIEDSFLREIVGHEAFKQFSSSLIVLILSKNFIQHIDSTTLVGFHNLIYLDLQDNFITEFDQALFSDLNKLVELHVESNLLKTFRNQQVELNLKNLKKVFLDNNFLKTLSKNLFSKMVKLKYLSINRNFLESIDKNWFGENDCLSLSNIRVSNNRIRSLDSSLFCRFRSLTYLSVADNHLESLDDENLFANLANLEYLILKENKLRTLNRNLFKNCCQLKQLDLSKNQLSKLEDNLFDALLALNELDLSNNRLEIIAGQRVFEGLQNLISMNLSHNRLKEIDENLFSKLDYVETIFVNHNLICRIDTNAFKHQLTLTSLHLNHNRSLNADQIQPETFSSLKRLKLLHLNDCGIDVLRSDRLSKLEAAIDGELHLNSNGLKLIEELSFISLRSLTKLNLSDNRLENLPEKAFNCLFNLELLNLEHNSLQQLDTSTFKGLNKLLDLNLSGNKLTCLQAGLFDGLRRVFSLKIASNRIESFKKDNQGDDFAVFSDLISLQALDLSENQISEFNWSMLIGLSELRSVNLSRNLLKHFDYADMIELIPTVNTINLSGNRIDQVLDHQTTAFNDNLIVNLNRNLLTELNFEVLLNNATYKKILELENNFILNLPDDLNRKVIINEIKKVNLNGNLISQVPDGFFKNTLSINLADNFLTNLNTIMENENLEDLDLSNNLFTHFNDDLLDKCNDLVSLKIDGNYLERLAVNLFQSKQYLRTINASRNYFRSFSDVFRQNDCCFNYWNHKVTSLDLSDNKIACLGERNIHLATYFSDLSKIAFKNNRIREIRPIFFKNCESIRQLDLSDNFLRHLNDQELFSSLKRLRELVLDKNRLVKLTKNLLRNQVSLERLSLKQNELTDDELLDSDLFRNLKWLESVDLSSNKLIDMTIFSKLFRHVHNLTELNLSKNLIQEIHQINSMMNLSKLKKLDLSQNRITYLESESIFSQISTLEELNLSGNILESIPESMFSKNFNLRNLNLSHNRLKSIEHSLFSHHHHSLLKILDLSCNKIESIGREPFKHLLELVELNLARNSIKSLNSCCFDDLIKLNQLNLSNNQIESIDEIIFKMKHLERLQYLNLQNNQIVKQISWVTHSDLMSAAMNLIELKIDNLEIKADEPVSTITNPRIEKIHLFNHNYSVEHQININSSMTMMLLLKRMNCSSLVELNLSGHNFGIIKSSYFDNNLNHLVRLDLSNNKIALIEPESFDKLARLESIDLSKNDLSGEFDLKIIKNCLKNNLKIINLSFNKIESLLNDEDSRSTSRSPIAKHCDLIDLSNNNLSDFVNVQSVLLLKFQMVNRLNLSSNNFETLNLIDHRSRCLFYAKEIDLSCNKIQSIHFNQSSSLFNLRKLKINRNKLKKIDLENLVRFLLIRSKKLSFLDIRDNCDENENESSFDLSILNELKSVNFFLTTLKCSYNNEIKETKAIKEYRKFKEMFDLTATPTLKTSRILDNLYISDPFYYQDENVEYLNDEIFNIHHNDDNYLTLIRHVSNYHKIFCST